MHKKDGHLTRAELKAVLKRMGIPATMPSSKKVGKERKPAKTSASPKKSVVSYKPLYSMFGKKPSKPVVTQTAAKKMANFLSNMGLTSPVYKKKVSPKKHP